MSLYTHVEAQPPSLHELARYFYGMGTSVNVAHNGAADARAKSEPWEGEGGDGFRALATLMYRDGAELAQAYYDTYRAVDNHAEEMTAVHRRMQDARGTAAHAGLVVTAVEIEDPGPAPPRPEPQPGSGYGGTANGASSAEQHRLMATYSDWADKAAVYAQCTTMVAEARTLEHRAQSELLDAIEGLVPDKPIIKTSDALTGLAAGYLARQTSLRKTAASFSKIATQAADAASDSTHSATTRSRNLMLSLSSEARGDIADAKANASRIGSWLEKQPKPVRDLLTKKIGRTFPTNKPYISRAPAVFKKVPVLGTVFSGAAVATDAIHGKDVTRSVVTSGSGLLAGAGVGFFAGGPLGALGGLIVGTGVSILTGEMYDAVVPQEGDSYPIAPAAPHPHVLKSFE